MKKYLYLLLLCLSCVGCNRPPKEQLSNFVIFTHVCEDRYPGVHYLYVYTKDDGYKELIRTYEAGYRHFNEEDSTYEVNFSARESFFDPFMLDDKHDYRIVLPDSSRYDINRITLRDTLVSTYDNDQGKYVFKTVKILKSYYVNGHLVIADHPGHVFWNSFHIPVEYGLPIERRDIIGDTENEDPFNL